MIIMVSKLTALILVKIEKKFVFSLNRYLYQSIDFNDLQHICTGEVILFFQEVSKYLPSYTYLVHIDTYLCYFAKYLQD